MGGRFTVVSWKFRQISSRQKANRIIPIIRRASERPWAESWHQEPQQMRQVPLQVQKGQWSRWRDGRRGLTARQLFAVVSLSQQLKEATAESTHLVSATQTQRTVTPRLKQKKALEDTKPSAKEGSSGAAELHYAPWGLSPGNERARPLLPRPPSTPTELRSSAWRLTTNPKPAFAPQLGEKLTMAHGSQILEWGNRGYKYFSLKYYKRRPFHRPNEGDKYCKQLLCLWFKTKFFAQWKFAQHTIKSFLKIIIMTLHYTSNPSVNIPPLRGRSLVSYISFSRS